MDEEFEKFAKECFSPLEFEKDSSLKEKWKATLKRVQDEMQSVRELKSSANELDKCRASIKLFEIQQQLSTVFNNKETENELEALESKRHELASKISLAIIQHF